MIQNIDGVQINVIPFLEPMLQLIFFLFLAYVVPALCTIGAFKMLKTVELPRKAIVKTGQHNYICNTIKASDFPLWL